MGVFRIFLLSAPLEVTSTATKLDVRVPVAYGSQQLVILTLSAGL